MEFAWDEVKRRANYAKHGLDFGDAEKVFEGITLTAEDDRPKIRLISMRKANQKERKGYEEKILFRFAAPPEDEG